MIKKTTCKLALVLLVVFAAERGLKVSATGATQATSAIEKSAVTEINSPAGAGSVDPSLSAGPDGRVYLSWLEPIKPKGYALKFAVRSRGGSWSTPLTITQRENRFDSSILASPDGMTVVYRDRSEKEVRDISIVRLKNGQWSKPEPLSQDGWEINGCPVNGPAISSAGENLAVAWFTAVRDQPRVHATLSADGGATFGPQILVDDGNPIGRVDIIALPSRNAFVSWVERTPSGAEVRARIVRPDRSKAPAIAVAEASSGFPRMQMSGDEVIIAWTDSRNIKVRTAILRITGN
jgi:hypothetical protein